MRSLAFALAISVAWAMPALAGPKDKSANNLVGFQSLAGNAVINNQTTATKVAQKGCKVQVQMKGLSGVSDGDLIICIGEADVHAALLPPTGAGNGIVLAGEVKNGQMKLKGDLTDVACGTQQSTIFNADMKCYLDDGAFLDANPLINWQKSCADAGMGAIPNPNPDAKKLKVNSTQNIVVGLCQGFSLGLRINPPVSLEIGRQGAFLQ